MSVQQSAQSSFSLAVSVCGKMYGGDMGGGNIQYEETRDYINTNFPTRKLTIDVENQDIFDIMLYERDENGMFDLFLIVLPSGDDEETFTDEIPFHAGRFKAVLLNGDTNVSIDEALDDESDLPTMNMVGTDKMEFLLYRDYEVDAFDNDNVNILTKGTELKSLIQYIFNAYTPFSYVISNPDHNPNTGMLLLPQSNIPDVLKLLDTDMGIYKTNYMMFLDEGIVYFLNQDNSKRCNSGVLDYNLVVRLSKMSKEFEPVSIMDTESGDRALTLAQNKISVNKEAANSVGATLNYVFPNGSKYKVRNRSSRNIKTVNKFTNVQPLEKTIGRVKETITINIDGSGVTKINPLSNIIYFDASQKMRKYRVSYVKFSCRSKSVSSAVVKGFRILEEGE